MPQSRILLVEDDPDLRPLLADVLLREGHSVDVAETALKAASLLEINSYNLVLTDCVLPDGNGVAIADKATAQGINALIMTGHTSHNPERELPRHEVIKKPMSLRDLRDAVARKLRST